VSGSEITPAEVLANHFVQSLIAGAKETEEFENELYRESKG
jgi:hypothetical protein